MPLDPDAPTLFFDIGGVLLTNGWDTAARKAAAEQFGLDYAEFQARHEMLKTAMETGRIGLDDYVARAVFHKPRSFSPESFKQLMFDASVPLGDTLEFVRALAATGRYRLYTLNNESRDLHEHRVRTYNLAPIFRGFLASCYLGQAKPDSSIYANALGIAGCPQSHAIFIDDRALNVESAQASGLDAYQFTDLDALRAYLAGRGVTA
jgi:putative hydrolase of the HAD superfamily